MEKLLRLLLTVELVSLIVLASGIQLHATGASSRNIETSLIATKTVPLTVKIVFIGFNQSNINTTYMLWKENIPFKRVNQILTEPKDTGVTFKLDYSFLFASADFEKDLVAYLKKIETIKEMPNPWFGVSIRNFLYDANKLEDWLYENRAKYGGFPSNGYTFFIANMTQLPSITYDQIARPWLKKPPTPHYLNVEYYDLDLGYRVRNREFMTAWGGHHGFWFLDLSAGPSFNTPNDAPLQAVTTALEIDVRTTYGSRWLTEYLSDYIWESVWNLAVPQFTYAPKYSEKYRIVVTVLDNRTKEEKEQNPITKTVKPDLIEKSYRNLLPYSNIEVVIKFQNCSDDKELLQEMASSYKRSRDATQSFIDLRPIYKFLQTRLGRYVANMSQNEKEYTIPVFCFAFSKSYLGYTYKWDVTAPSPGEETLWGLAQEDMVICALTQENEFDRGNIVEPPQPGKGIGFSQLIIHEVGHIFGLMHPHQYGDTHDFVSSAMSYFCHDYNFSQFDKDALRRMHTDQIMFETTVKLSELRNTAAAKVTGYATISELNEVETLLAQVDKEYSSMNYTSALLHALNAKKHALQSSTKVAGLPNMTVFLAQWIFILGAVVGYLIKRRQDKVPPGTRSQTDQN